MRNFQPFYMSILSPFLTLTRLSALTAIWGQKRWDWLENSNSTVSLDGEKLAQLIRNREKLETGVTSQNFSRQIPPDFPAPSKN